MDEEHVYKADVITDLTQIDSHDWNALAGDNNPFVRYEFLSALELSGSATAETGWLAHHILIYEQMSEKPIAAMPLYLKNHSYGEYVFDHGWADAYARSGRQYYPKLQSSVPFTPAKGPRFLTGTNSDRSKLCGLLLNAAQQLTTTRGASSLHITFIDKESCDQALKSGMLERNDIQYHWQNHDYSTFDAFLESLTSRKRKQIKKERKSALESGIEIKWLGGNDITENDWDHFFDFYIDTGNRKWGTPYLNREFFSIIGKSMPENTLLMMAYRGGNPIAGALNFIGGDTLFGRHWGCSENVKNLHFELCYYQAIDYAIEHGLTYVEAGAQGQHKIARGYVPTKTRSAHWLSDPGFQDAVADYLKGERLQIDLEIKALREHTPFAKEKRDIKWPKPKA